MDKKKLDLFFDLDGTLIDISMRHFAVYCDIVFELKGKIITEEEYWIMKRNKLGIGEILRKSLVDEKFASYFTSRFKDLIETYKYLKLDKVFPYSFSVLKTLFEKYDLFLVTFRRSRELTTLQLNRMGLSSFFKTIKSRSGNEENIIKFKSRAINELRGDNKAAIVGDTEIDILVGKNLKILSIAVLSGMRNRKKLELYSPDYIIKDISYLPKILA